MDTVLLDDIPIPAAVAARPRDARGFPVLAITPWEDGEPLLAETAPARVHICAAERRCSVCGLEMAPGPVWRIADGEEAEAIAAAQSAGKAHAHHGGTAEPPGHRACVLYTAVAYPWPAGPGDGRAGVGGAVLGFDGFEYAYADYVMFLFHGLREFRPHTRGDEHVAALAEAVAAEARAGTEAGTPPLSECPPYLLADEEAAELRQLVYLRAV
jgi:hypothetical protein